MPARAAAHAAYLAGRSPRYLAAYDALGREIKKRFPKAKPVFQWDMPAWVVARPAGAPMPERAGTMDPHTIFVGLVERAGGITTHVWYPGDYHLLSASKAELAEAGFKVMVGCLQYNRKTGDYPVAPVAALLDKMRAMDGA